MFRSIVVPLDGSRLAETILPHVRDLAADTAMELVLLSVATMPPIPPARQPHDRAPHRGIEVPFDQVRGVGDRRSPVAPATQFHKDQSPTALGPSLDHLMAREEQHWQQYLKEHAQQLTATGLLVQVRVRFGDAAIEIVRCAEEERADAIAMSTHGRTGVDHLIHGSVAGAVLRASGLPVLLFRPRPSVFAQQQTSPASS